jgi:hypothetical protein
MGGGEVEIVLSHMITSKIRAGPWLVTLGLGERAFIVGVAAAVVVLDARRREEEECPEPGVFPPPLPCDGDGVGRLPGAQGEGNGRGREGASRSFPRLAPRAEPLEQ